MVAAHPESENILAAAFELHRCHLQADHKDPSLYRMIYGWTTSDESWGLNDGWWRLNYSGLDGNTPFKFSINEAKDASSG